MYHHLQIKLSLEVSATFIPQHGPFIKVVSWDFFRLLDWQRTPPSPPSPAAFEVWSEPSDPSIPPHSPGDSWKTNLEIYGLFWSAAGQPAGDPGSSFDLAKNVWNVNVGNLKPSTFKTQKGRTSKGFNSVSETTKQGMFRTSTWTVFDQSIFWSRDRPLRLRRPRQECLEPSIADQLLLH